MPGVEGEQERRHRKPEHGPSRGQNGEQAEPREVPGVVRAEHKEGGGGEAAGTRGDGDGVVGRRAAGQAGGERQAGEAQGCEQQVERACSGRQRAQAP